MNDEAGVDGPAQTRQEGPMSHGSPTLASPTPAHPVVRALQAGGPVALTSLLGGLVTRAEIPGWYATLARPSFSPPNWVFAPVWTVLFTMMAVAAWRVLSLPRGTPGRRTALRVFHAHLLVNLGWSVAFFGLRSPGLALVVIAALFAAILLTMDRFRRLDRTAAWLLVPYAAWVAFAAVLNGAIVRLN